MKFSFKLSLIGFCASPILAIVFLCFGVYFLFLYFSAMTLMIKFLNYPKTQEEVVPCVKKLIQDAIEHLNQRETPITKEETIGFLQMALECTEPKPNGNMDKGYFYCPYPVALQNPPDLTNFDPNRPILTRYGKKLLESERKEILIKNQMSVLDKCDQKQIDFALEVSNLYSGPVLDCPINTKLIQLRCTYGHSTAAEVVSEIEKLIGDTKAVYTLCTFTPTVICLDTCEPRIRILTRIGLKSADGA